MPENLRLRVLEDDRTVFEIGLDQILLLGRRRNSAKSARV
jgi:hypothetical protein